MAERRDGGAREDTCDEIFVWKGEQTCVLFSKCWVFQVSFPRSCHPSVPLYPFPVQCTHILSSLTHLETLSSCSKSFSSLPPVLSNAGAVSTTWPMMSSQKPICGFHISPRCGRVEPHVTPNVLAWPLLPTLPCGGVLLAHLPWSSC